MNFKKSLKKELKTDRVLIIVKAILLAIMNYTRIIRALAVKDGSYFRSPLSSLRDRNTLIE